jgi:hypothetical protein
LSVAPVFGSIAHRALLGALIANSAENDGGSTENVARNLPPIIRVLEKYKHHRELRRITKPRLRKAVHFMDWNGLVVAETLAAIWSSDTQEKL